MIGSRKVERRKDGLGRCFFTVCFHRFCHSSVSVICSIYGMRCFMSRDVFWVNGDRQEGMFSGRAWALAKMK
jgi:hypothetical protein